MVDDPRIEPMELARPPIYALERANSEYSAGRKTIEVIPTRVKADSFQGFQNGASSESCPSASATGPMHDAQCGLVLGLEPVTAASKSLLLGIVILATAALFVPLRIEHPFVMVLFLVLTAVSFSLFGFIIGLWADGFEKLQLVPLLIVTPLPFLGGSFYSVDMLPPF